MARVRSGDPDAAEELVRQYESAVRIAVRARLTDPTLRRQLDTQDICQSVLASFFVRAATGEYDLDSPGQLVGLLVRMAQNKLFSQARYHGANRRDARKNTSLPTAGEPASDEPGPQTLVARRELLAVVRDMLSPAEREIADRRLEGRDWVEIAAILGGTPDQVRMQFTRALDRVTAKLGLHEDG